MDIKIRSIFLCFIPYFLLLSSITYAQPDCPAKMPDEKHVNMGSYVDYWQAKDVCVDVMNTHPTNGGCGSGNAGLIEVPQNCGGTPSQPQPFTMFYDFYHGASGDDACNGRGSDSSGRCNDDGEEDLSDSCSDYRNPINAVNGNKHQTELDFISQIGSLPLKIERTYNSWTEEFGIFGRNWSSNLSIYSSIDVASGIAKVRLMDGRLLTFADNGTAWESLGRLGNSLVEVGVEYHLKLKSGEVYHFNSAGRLIRLEDEYGQALTYSYNSSTQLLEKLTDHYGNKLDIQYYPNTNLVQTITVMGKTYTYGYDQTTTPYQSRLETVDYPDETGSVTRTYVYKDTSDVRTRYALVGIIDEEGIDYISWTYNKWGFAYNVEKKGAVERTYIGRSFDASPDPYVSARNYSSAAEYKTDRLYLREGNNGRLQVKRNAGLAGTKADCRAAGKHMTYDNKDSILAYTDDLGPVSGEGENGPDIVEAMERDSLGRIITDTTGYRWIGNVVDYEVVDYTELLTLLEEGLIMTRVVTEWHPTFNKKTKITYSGKTLAAGWVTYRVEDYVYESNGRLDSVTFTDNTSFTSPYSTNGKQRVWDYSYTYHDIEETKPATIAVDGPLPGAGDTTTIHYDANGRKTQVVNGLGQATNYSNFNASGLPQTITNANGAVSSIGYDARNRIKTITEAAGTALATTAQIDYYKNGLIKRNTIALGTNEEIWVEYSYNDARQLIRIDNSYGDYTVLTPSALNGDWVEKKFYDNSGLLKGTQKRTLDQLGRVRELLYDDGTQKALNLYEEHDELYSLKLGGDSSTEVVRLYDALTRLSQINHADGGVSKYDYDVQGNLSKVTDQRELETTYIYDGFGELIRQTSPDTGTTDYWYDEAGNRTKKIDARNVETIYAYDVLNRLTNTSYTGDSTKNVVYSYDNVSTGNYNTGHLTGITDESGSSTYVYDVLGRVYIRQNIVEGVPYLWAYDYDKAGNLKGITYPSGRVVDYVRDGGGRITGVDTIPWQGTQAQNSQNTQSILSNATYYPFGPIHTYDYGNGITQSFDYDTDGRLDLVSSSGANDVLDWDIDYYATGNIETITDINESARTQSFDYDSTGRLDTASGIYGDLDYDYDLVGNRKKLTVGASSLIENYTYSEVNGVAQSNQLDSISQIPGSSYTNFNYTASGHLGYEPRSGVTRVFDDADRAESLSSGSVAATYVYNGLGQRAVKISVTPTIEHIHFHYDDQGRLMLETDSNGRVIREYVYMDNLRVAVISPNAADDSDSDGLDDDWETQFFGGLSQTGTGDYDGDGITNQNEFNFGTHPGVVNFPGLDQDAMDDSWEVLYFGNLDRDGSGDFDEDGISDQDEYILGYDPTKPSLDWLVPWMMIAF